jgi:acyl-CoA thioesterase II
LPDIPAIHQCVLAYASDMTLLDAALAPHGRTLFEREFMAASLDHALWLHRPFRADDWLLYAQDSPNLYGSRGFSRGLIFTRDGTLVASVAQEGLVRNRR